MVRGLFRAIYRENSLKDAKTVFIKIPFLKKRGNYLEVIEDGHFIEVINGKVKLKIYDGHRDFDYVGIFTSNKIRLTIYGNNNTTIKGMNDGFVVTGYFCPKLGDKIRIDSYFIIQAKEIDFSLKGYYELGF